MILQKSGGSIVTVASIGGHKAISGQSNAVYCASKGAVLSFTKSFAVEVAKHGIRVNSISPGYILTNMTPGYVAKDLKKLELFEALPPLKRIADRAEVKSLVPFLLSNASSYITGTDVLIDGGILA
jgi:sorbose reductase